MIRGPALSRHGYELTANPLILVLPGLAPLILFILVSRLSTDLALWLAFTTAFVVALRHFLKTRNLRMLDVANVIIFGLLALFSGLLERRLPFSSTRLAVDVALFLVVAVSLVAQKPFTLTYLKGVPIASKNHFARANVRIALFWTACLSAMALADAAASLSVEIAVRDAAAADLLLLALALWLTWRSLAAIDRVSG